MNAFECITKADTQKDFTKQVNKFKGLAYLFHSKHELVANLLKPINMKPLNRKLLLDTIELEKERSHLIVEILEYVPNAVLSKTIFEKITGNGLILKTVA